MAECDNVALRLNTRPRKTLDWQTPGKALNQSLVATAV
jgi:IS30 family transposase